MFRWEEEHVSPVEVITSIQRRRSWSATKEKGNNERNGAVRQQHIIGCPEIRYPSHREIGEKRINQKRICSIMKANHLLLQKHTGLPAPAHTGMVITLAGNIRWCLHILEILYYKGQKIRTTLYHPSRWIAAIVR